LNWKNLKKFEKFFKLQKISKTCNFWKNQWKTFHLKFRNLKKVKTLLNNFFPSSWKFLDVLKNFWKFSSQNVNFWKTLKET
jgi:hypothetical protein